MVWQSNKQGLTLANKISIYRFLGVPIFVLLLTYYILGLKQGDANEYHRVAALAVFVLLALTDALDGYVARSRGEITRLGEILDPLADKALLLSALILLTRPSLTALQPQFPIGFTALVISRDMVLLLGALVIHHLSGVVEVRPRLTGKLATALLMAAICFALLNGPVRPFRVLVWVTGFFVAVSMLQYLVHGFRQLEQVGHK